MARKPLKYIWFLSLIGLALTFGLTGCSTVASVPGETNSVNHGYFDSKDDFLTRVTELRKGMRKDEVFKILGKDMVDFNFLTKSEILMALYGTNQIEPSAGMKSAQGLKGYSLIFGEVQARHGFSSPVSMKTKQQGFRYTVTLIFEGDTLYEDALIAGGDVYDTNSKTLFDLITPSRIFSAAL
tara:strand:+ start:485 stop:1033 length:549 start_codon:yes stop_codon:yes gene_type:complete